MSVVDSSMIVHVHDHDHGETRPTILTYAQCPRHLTGFARARLMAVIDGIVRRNWGALVTELSSEARAQIAELCEMVLAVAALDFERRVPAKGSGDEMDALAIGLNALAEELGAAVEAASGRAHLEAIFETMSEGIVVFGADGAVEKVNDEALSLLGATLDETVGRNFEEIFADPGEAQNLRGGGEDEV